MTMELYDKFVHWMFKVTIYHGVMLYITICPISQQHIDLSFTVLVTVTQLHSHAITAEEKCQFQQWLQFAVKLFKKNGN